MAFTRGISIIATLALASLGSLMAKLGSLGVKFGEFYVCKWTVSASAGQNATIHERIITKPVPILSKLPYGH